MNNKTKANLIFNLHIVVTIANLLLPVILPLRYLFIGLIFSAFIVVHWTIFKGCILTILENKYNNKQNHKTLKGQFVDRALNKFFGLDLSERQLKGLNLSMVVYIFSTYAFRYSRNILITCLVGGVTAILYLTKN